MGKLNRKLSKELNHLNKLESEIEEATRSLKNLHSAFFLHAKKKISESCNCNSFYPTSGNLYVNIEIMDKRICVVFQKVNYKGYSTILISSEDTNKKIKIEIRYCKGLNRWFKRGFSFRYGFYFFKPITPGAIEIFLCDLF